MTWTRIIRLARFTAAASALLLFFAPATRADSQEPTIGDLPIDVHPLSGLWWLKTIYDESGEPVWSGASKTGDGVDEQPITMQIRFSGEIDTLAACNSYFGSFGPVDGDLVALDPPQMMTTRIMCWGEYPPVVRFEQVVRYERDRVELRLFDAQNRPIATYIDVYGMRRELERALGDDS